MPTFRSLGTYTDGIPGSSDRLLFETGTGQPRGVAPADLVTGDFNGAAVVDYTSPSVAGVSGTLTQATHGGRVCNITGTTTVPVANGFVAELANKSGAARTIQPASGNLIHEGTTKANISLPNLRSVAVRGDGTDVWVYGALS